jgi:hypothetical protein
MELAYITVFVKIVFVGLVWSVDARFLPYCSLMLVSLVLFSFCSMLLLLIWFVLIRPLSGLESGFEVFLPYCNLFLVLLCCSVSAVFCFF